MSTITLSLKEHKGEERIFAEFTYSKKINDAIKQIPAAKWSQSNKQWHLPSEKKSVIALRQKIDSLAAINTSILKKQLEEKKNSPKSLMKKDAAATPARSVHPINAHVLPSMRQQLKLKAYSPSTAKTYLNEMSQLLQALVNIPADELKAEHLKRYLVYCFEKLHLKENTLHSRINAMKFYYEQVLGREKFFWQIPRPKKRFILPKVLGETELKRLFNGLQNKKHKAILFTAYSAGLRVSEVVNLELKHIDRSRMQLFIKNAKGKKDRYVMLSPLLLDILSNYYKTCKPQPTKYLFEGPEPGTPYSASSMQKIFQTARKNAGIHKSLTFHSLRHSFATHLLEKGVDIKYIRDLMGHFDIRTTARYLHVSREQLVNIESPLDGLLSKDEI
jgi:integrase/recombinase XerD